METRFRRFERFGQARSVVLDAKRRQEVESAPRKRVCS